MAQVNENQVFVFDFTLPAAAVPSKDAIIHWLDLIEAKNWVFQLEEGKGANKYLHYQGRFKLANKTRVKSLINKNAKLGDESLIGIHLSTTSSVAAKGFDYVTKSETRKDGPWSKEQHLKMLNADPDIIEMTSDKWIWRPWQLSTFELFKTTRDRRKVNYIIDRTGGSGKSSFSNYCDFIDIATWVPPMNSKDMMAFCMKFKAKSYIIDLPKNFTQSKTVRINLFNAIEALKNGMLYDLRYDARKERIPAPNVIIFANEAPDTSLLSRDRWVVWEINTKLELVPFQG